MIAENHDLVPSVAPRRRPHVTAVELDGRAVLYRSEDGSMHWLDELGTLLWNCFDGDVPLNELVDDLAHVYPGEERETIERDLLALVERLLDDGLVELGDGRRPA